ncbi:ATP-binding cassette domain-containing protein [Segnochrobactraceae bacterium EtOH-i3]
MSGTRRLVTVTGLSVDLGGRQILRDIELAVDAGEIVTLIGPNGGGKSTLVKTVLGLVRPSSGRVERAAGLRIGYVPQKLSIGWSMPLTVARLMTLTVRASRAAVLAALEETGVAHLAEAQAHTLSGGEFQRVLIARALMARPDLLVLDEPVQGVDFTGEQALYQLISEVRTRRGCGVLLVSHDLHVVMAATDRVFCLNGHVCCAGVPSVVADDPAYARLFGPRAGLAIYRHHHDHVHPMGPHDPACTHDHDHDHGHAHAHSHEHAHAHDHDPAGHAHSHGPAARAEAH